MSCVLALYLFYKDSISKRDQFPTESEIKDSVETGRRAMTQTCTTENLTTENPEKIKKKLFNSVMLEDWEKVATIYKKYPSAHTITITSSGGTALHLAISDPSKYKNKKLENVEKLVLHIKDKDPLKVLKLQTEKGNTPLHLAAATGQSGKLCKLLIESVGGVKNKNALDLVGVRCKKGETPLFKAVHFGRPGSFFYLNLVISEHYGKQFSNFETNDSQSILNDPIISSILVRKDGQSILHEAIIREHFGLAFYIIKLYRGLVNLVDNQGESPLHALARKPAAFKSGSSLHGWDKLIYKCISAEKLKSLEPEKEGERERDKESHPINIESGEGSNIAEEILKRSKRSRKTCRIWYCFVIFGYGRKAVDRIYKEKLKRTRAKQVLDELLEHYTMYENNTTAQQQDEDSEDVSSSSGANTVETDESSKQKNTALLIAAEYGIVEMVKRIIKKFPVAIFDEDTNGNNVLLLAVKKRHLQLFKYFINKYIDKSVVYQREDEKGNTALHLAATYDEQLRPWPVPGAALQMQWEIKWYEFVEYTMPSSLFLRTNKEHKTSRDIFSTTHKNLIKDGKQWLQETARSCSVVAALIVTIAFASSTTVPGGTDSNTGKPILRNNSIFNIFAIASLIALCFSVTALITFLVILTSRYHERDFGKNLPWKILMGLTSLFWSVAAMLVTFCAGHFLVLEVKIKYATFPIYVVTFIPLFLFAVAQFPLYFDLVRAIFSSPSRYDFSFLKEGEEEAEVSL